MPVKKPPFNPMQMLTNLAPGQFRQAVLGAKAAASMSPQTYMGGALRSQPGANQGGFTTRSNPLYGPDQDAIRAAMRQSLAGEPILTVPTNKKKRSSLISGGR